MISLANENNQNIYSAVSDGLRDQSAEAARRLAAAPPAAVLEYAAALGAVFQDCRAAYGWMVEKADGHAGDVRTHREAWPVTRPESAVVFIENNVPQIGREIARENAVNQIWPLLGFRLRDELAR